MTYSNYIKSIDIKLNSLQKKMVEVISNLKSEDKIIWLFTGKKACPYRKLQEPWDNFRRIYNYEN